MTNAQQSYDIALRSVDSKSRPLFTAIAEVVKAAACDLYGQSTTDDKYVKIVDLIMLRVRSALQKQLSESTSLQTAAYADISKNQIAAISDIAQNLLSALNEKANADNMQLCKLIVTTAQNAFQEFGTDFSDIISTLRYTIDENKDQLKSNYELQLQVLDSILRAKDELLNAIKDKQKATDKDNRPSNQLEEKHTVKRNKTDSQPNDKKSQLLPIKNGQPKNSFKALSAIEKSLTLLQRFQVQQADLSAKHFKDVNTAIQKNVASLDANIVKRTDTISTAVQHVEDEMSELNNDNSGSLFGKLMTFAKDVILSPVSALFNIIWSGIKGVTKLAFKALTFPLKLISKFVIQPIFKALGNAVSFLMKPLTSIKSAIGNVLSKVGKVLSNMFFSFIKTPAGMFALGYVIGFVYFKWIKPFWSKHISPMIDKVTNWWNESLTYDNFKKGLIDWWKETNPKLKSYIFGKESENKSWFDLVKEAISNVVVVEDGGFVAKLVNKIGALAGKVTGIPESPDSSKLTLGTLFNVTAIGIAASLAASVVNSPIIATITGLALAVNFIKEKLSEWFGTQVSQTTAGNVVASGLHLTTQPLRQATNAATDVIKTEKVAKKAVDAAKNVANKVDDLGKAQQFAAASGDASKAAKIGEKGEKLLEKGIKLEERAAEALKEAGVAEAEAGKFAKWLSKHPKILAKLKTIGKLGIFVQSVMSVWDMYNAYNAYKNGDIDLAKLKAGKAFIGAASLLGGPVTMAAAFGAEMILDKTEEWQNAMNESQTAFDDLSKSQAKLWKSYLEKGKRIASNMTPDQLLELRLKNFEKTKEKIAFHKEKQKQLEDSVNNSGFIRQIFRSGTIQDEAAAANAEATEIQKALSELGFSSERQFNEFEKWRKEYLAKTPKIDFEEKSAIQQTLEQMRADAAKTAETDDDELVKSLDNDFKKAISTGNVQLFQQIKELILSQKNSSINDVTQNTFFLQQPQHNMLYVDRH